MCAKKCDLWHHSLPKDKFYRPTKVSCLDERTCHSSISCTSCCLTLACTNTPPTSQIHRRKPQGCLFSELGLTRQSDAGCMPVLCAAKVTPIHATRTTHTIRATRTVLGYPIIQRGPPALRAWMASWLTGSKCNAP